MYGANVSLLSLGVRRGRDFLEPPCSRSFILPGFDLGVKGFECEEFTRSESIFFSTMFELEVEVGGALKPKISATVSVDSGTEGERESKVNPKPVLGCVFNQGQEEAPQSTLIEVSINFN